MFKRRWNQKRELKIKTMVIIFSCTQIISYDRNWMCDSLDQYNHAYVRK